MAEKNLGKVKLTSSDIANIQNQVKQSIQGTYNALKKQTVENNTKISEITSRIQGIEGLVGSNGADLLITFNTNTPIYDPEVIENATGDSVTLDFWKYEDTKVINIQKAYKAFVLSACSYTSTGTDFTGDYGLNAFLYADDGKNYIASLLNKDRIEMRSTRYVDTDRYIKTTLQIYYNLGQWFRSYPHVLKATAYVFGLSNTSSKMGLNGWLYGIK